MAEAAEKPASEAKGQSIAERFAGREPVLDVVRLSAPWRPFAHERPSRRRL